MLLGAAATFLYVDLVRHSGNYEIEFCISFFGSTALRIASKIMAAKVAPDQLSSNHR
jgi:hypothetical protein